MISYGFAVLGTSDIRRKETPKEARRINAERKHRRLEKKENCWKTQKKQGKDKVCSFHFHFILWTWGWCVLGRIFGFVVRMRDKKARVQRRKWHNINGPIFFFFFFFSCFSLTHETRPQLSNPEGSTAARTVHYIFCARRVLGLKNRLKRRF